jgi:hypothetical protein
MKMMVMIMMMTIMMAMKLGALRETKTRVILIYLNILHLEQRNVSAYFIRSLQIKYEESSRHTTARGCLAIKHWPTNFSLSTELYIVVGVMRKYIYKITKCIRHAPRCKLLVA